MREISSPLYEIGVAEQEYEVRFCTGSSNVPPKVAPNPKIAQNSVRDYCLALLAMQLVNSTRRRSESAYVRQANFFTAFIEGWEEDGAPLKPSLYLEPFSK